MERQTDPHRNNIADPSWTYLWELEQGVTFLNHGSFGACPKAVLQAQADWRLELEREPVRFFRELEPRLEKVRMALGELRRLFEEYRIEVPIYFWPYPPHRLLRISTQLYNTLADYEKLASALQEALGQTAPSH